MEDVFHKAQENLGKLSKQQLKTLLHRHAEWFDEIDTFNQGLTANFTPLPKKKEHIITYIMMSDPIYSEGGLFDFLHSENMI